MRTWKHSELIHDTIEGRLRPLQDRADRCQRPRKAFLDCSGVRLMLGQPQTAEFDHLASIIYYRVEDIQAAHETLCARGVQFEAGPRLVHKAHDHDLWLAFFRDVEGNLLALMSEVPHP